MENPPALPQFRIRPLELILGLSLAGWGIQLLNPFTNMFEQYEAAYSVMAVVAPENVWGVFMAASGLSLVYASLTGRVGLVKLSLLIVFMFRVFQLVKVGLATSFTVPSMADFTAWVMLALFAYIKAGSNYVNN